VVKAALLGGVSALGGVNWIGAMTLVAVPLVDLLKNLINICGDTTSSARAGSGAAGISLEMTVVSVAAEFVTAGAVGFAAGVTATGGGSGATSGGGNTKWPVAGWGAGRKRREAGPTRGR